MTQVVYNPSDIDFAKPGKHHYQLAFQMDSNWGSSLDSDHSDQRVEWPR